MSMMMTMMVAFGFGPVFGFALAFAFAASSFGRTAKRVASKMWV
jgi:hypothetical protein